MESQATEQPRRPDPIVERDNAFFWEAAKQGRFVTRDCDACGNKVHPPTPMCPRCQGLKWTEVPLSGKATVTGWMKVHHPPTPMFDYPVTVAVVKLEEGFIMPTSLVEMDGREIEIGMPVEVTFAPTAGGWQVPVFRPAR